MSRLYRPMMFLSSRVLVPSLPPDRLAIAQALSIDVVISRVYGGGGDADAVFKHDLHRGSTTTRTPP